eukprot:CAMPEP_0206556568 /NCGR_PEP_ID=MMETSP0325_2-20121206/18529_1 /ASSEMBLY_ACC=CAM_ASM_000347 /TAXON_ID=2866 /ORGANISM="Crypthecodinium cohnii, Strain Seligo" /LENGTH=57 /DNA_ID=CAMNT_0054057209 /DNA_START=68 /DNA_END=237 /DNA_ORIENTATION=+
MFATQSKTVLRLTLRAPASASGRVAPRGFASLAAPLQAKVDGFCKDVEKHLPKDGKG